MKTVPEPTNKKEMNFLVIDGTRHWLNIYNLFYKKNIKMKERQFPDYYNYCMVVSFVSYRLFSI